MTNFAPDEIAEQRGTRLPLGIRLNNPLNIKRATAMGARVDIDWRGLANDHLHPTFCTFSSRVYGFRAAGRILINYERRGTVILDDIIDRWAPPSDNNPTRAYAEFVAKRSGLFPTSTVLFSDYARLLDAMAYFENGLKMWHRYEIEDGLTLAERK